MPQAQASHVALHKQYPVTRRAIITTCGQGDGGTAWGNLQCLPTHPHHLEAPWQAWLATSAFALPLVRPAVSRLFRSTPLQCPFQGPQVPVCSAVISMLSRSSVPHLRSRRSSVPHLLLHRCSLSDLRPIIRGMRNQITCVLSHWSPTLIGSRNSAHRKGQTLLGTEFLLYEFASELFLVPLRTSTLHL